MKNTKHIIFDLDGTLLDSKRCFEVSLVEAYGSDSPVCYQCYGLSQTQILCKLGIPVDERAAFVETWQSCVLHQPCYLFPGIESMLQHLKQRKYHLSVISSRSVASLRWTLERMGILHYFNDIFGEELASQPKPSPLPMLQYIKWHGVGKEDVFYIGDLPTDEQCAVDAGVDFAYAGWNKDVQPDGSKSFESAEQCVRYFDALSLDLFETSFPKKLERGMGYFRQKVVLLNKLNYFPVPDDDTGSNMERTLTTALQKHAKNPNAPFGNLLLESARGNSGIILASAIKGFLDALDCEKSISHALEAMYKQAYKSVLHPKEGTMLTFLKQLALSFEDSMIVDCHKFQNVMKTALFSTQTSLTDGRVDSGALGVFYLVEALLGIRVNVEIPTDFINKQVELQFAYCTELTLQPNAEFVAEHLVDEIQNLGDSINRVFCDGVFKLHVHTNRPCHVFRLASQYGKLLYTKIDNMQLESQQQKPFALLCILDFGAGHEVLSGLAVEYVTANTLQVSLAEKIQRLGRPTLVFCDRVLTICTDNNAIFVQTNGIVSALSGLLVAVECNTLESAFTKSKIACSCVEDCNENYTLAICGEHHVLDDSIARYVVQTDRIFGGRVKQ